MIPNLKFERELFDSGFEFVIGMDEVGRGAFGGPVMVGACLIASQVGPAPTGLRDSKLLTAIVREKLVPEVKHWATAVAVGNAQPAEIDELGMTAALRLAGMRALELLPVSAGAIVLDGSHDWLTPPAADLFTEVTEFNFDVHMMVKADLNCVSVAGASVVAKVERDNFMRQLEAVYPGYGWASHVGYGTAAHRAAIAKLGLSPAHRKSWKLTAENSD